MNFAYRLFGDDRQLAWFNSLVYKLPNSITLKQHDTNHTWTQKNAYNLMTTNKNFKIKRVLTAETPPPRITYLKYFSAIVKNNLIRD